jgi:hypothetical protein
MVSSFAGRHRNVGLGRSDSSQRSPPRRAVAPTTTDALRAPRRGTTSAHALKKRGHPTRGPARHSRQGDASFTRSEGPCTSIVAQLAAAKPSRGHADCDATRSGKPGQPGRTGTVAAQDGRSAARHASSAPQGVQHGALKKRKTVSGRRPYEDPRVEVEVPARRSSCRSR